MSDLQLDGELDMPGVDGSMVLRLFQEWLREKGYDFFGWVSDDDMVSQTVISVAAMEIPEAEKELA